MNSYITTYKGVKLYLVTYEEFVQMHKQGVAKDGYIISDKKNALIVKGQVIGHTFDSHRKLAPAQIIRKWQEVFDYKEPKVVTERPTVESFVTAGHEKLKAVLEESPVAKANAEEKLNELVAEGNKAMEKVVAEGEAIRKNARKHTPRKRVTEKGV